MPEGPEIYILAKSLKENIGLNVTSYGKHLFIELPVTDEMSGGYANWSFGLNGGIHVDENNHLSKKFNGNICGEIKKIDNLENCKKKLGYDLMTATYDEIDEVVKCWQKSRCKLGSLILGQQKLSGIGVAWGSEILNLIELRPELKACDQDLSLLTQNIVSMRDCLKECYGTRLSECINTYDAKQFINSWPELLYSGRDKFMNVYKKGKKISVAGRSWWVKND
jgi:formamidopyrimidine-DNA glycosylase